MFAPLSPKLKLRLTSGTIHSHPFSTAWTRTTLSQLESAGSNTELRTCSMQEDVYQDQHPCSHPISQIEEEKDGVTGFP